MARLYSNENFPFPVVDELRRLGHEVTTVQSTAQVGIVMSDEQVIDFAATHGLILLTLNRRHFVRLHLERPNHAGIIVCTFDPDFVAQAQRIHVAIGSDSHLAGKLVRINRPSG